MKQRSNTSEAPKVSKTADKTSKYGPKAKVSFRRHILPVFGGIFVMLAVLGALNSQYLVALWHYRFAPEVAAAPIATPSTPNVATDSVNTASPNPERGPLLTISSIKVEAPIIFESSFEEWKIQVALRDGVVHYGNTPMPGQPGNTVILGHSSGQPWAKGGYKFVFTMLEKVEKGETISLDYQGTRYTYKVTGKFVVTPTDASVLEATEEPTLTLITCTPVGTSTNRLIIKAEQISPAPKAATQADLPPSPVPQQLPASASQSLWDRLRDLF